MSDPSNIPTVSIFDLVPDRCNYKDTTFESFVDRFMEKHMPGFSTSILERDDCERWEIVEDDPSEYIRYVETFDAEGDLICTRYCADYEGCEETFEDEDEAIDFVQERMGESRYGHPWAQYWGFMPNELITNEELGEAGFTVAYYTGGDGDRYRLCGIDGGGYSFSGQHYAMLCALVHENRSHYGWRVLTNEGHAYITAKRTVSPAKDNVTNANIEGA
jgi:hypothetical protein